MADADGDNLEDYIIPILLESSEGFKPMVAKRKFERVAALLAKQAYWLAWFEWIDKMGPKVQGVRFVTKGRSWRDPKQEPAWARGHKPSPREIASFEQTAKRAHSKLYAKLAPDENVFLGETFKVAASAVDDLVASGDRDRVIGAVLGPQLAALRMSKNERGALEALLWEPAADKELSKGAGRPRI